MQCCKAEKPHGKFIMTGKSNSLVETGDVLNQNLKKLDLLTKRFLTVVQNKKSLDPGLQGPGQDLAISAASAYWQNMAENPYKILEQQVEFWGKTLQNMVEMQHAFVASDAPTIDSYTKDSRFENPLWSLNPYFNFVKNQYLQNSDLIKKTAQNIDGLSEKERKRLIYFTDQIVEMMAPTNFLGTNPDALELALKTNGQSLIDGLENLIADLEANDGELIVRLADEQAFEVGKNLGTQDGQVVFRNRLLELIQYSPKTKTVHQIPLVIFPPWINKFYILDLRKQNSFISWLVSKGYTVFVVSWINPDDSYSDVGMDDYITEGYLNVIQVIKSITSQKQINAIGYCIGGTTLGLTIAYLNKINDNSIRAATFFTTLTDFAEQGEFTPFLQNDFIDSIEREVTQSGILKSFIMARTFSFLRSNDLIYSPAIKSYMMGQSPPAFDLLYWNGDGSNLPGKMAIEYLRGLCQKNSFSLGKFEVGGTTISLNDISVPICAIGCETDHIAAWKDSYRGVQLMGSKDKKFILAESGHIAGIINPPHKNKYGYYLNENLDSDAETWQINATHFSGSWWPVWEKWIGSFSGEKVKARKEGSKSYPSLSDAPGTYVLQKS